MEYKTILNKKIYVIKITYFIKRMLCYYKNCWKESLMYSIGNIIKSMYLSINITLEKVKGI